MIVAILTTDSREHFGEYEKKTPYFGTAPAALLEGFAALPDVEVHVISCLQRRIESDEKLASNIWFHGLHVPKIGWMRSGFLGCIRAVRRRLKTIRPDIVHGQGTERDCAMSAVFSGLPNVVTIHGNMRKIARLKNASAFSYAGISALLEGFVLPKTDGVVCITNYTRNAVKDRARRMWVVPNAVDKRFLDVSPKPPSPPIVLCVGLVCAYKNQNLLIRALDALAAELPFRLVFLGNANASHPYGADFFALLGSRPWCEYAGFAGREELQQRLSKATILALPSLEDNCPMVVLEAMAAGVPVAAAEIGGVPDLIEDGVTGLLFQPQDAGSIRNAVASMMKDSALRARLSQTARTRAIERFLPECIAAKHVEIYREVLSNPW